jgi:hypothetical protein
MKPTPAAFPWPLGVYAKRVEHHGYAGQATESGLILRAAQYEGEWSDVWDEE